MACWVGSTTGACAADTSKDEVERARSALELRIAQATADAIVAQRAAEARKAAADADRAEMLARVPPATARPLAGSVDTAHFGAAGLVKAFDLALELAREVCANLPADKPVVVYEPAASQGIVAARTVNDSIDRLTEELSRQNDALQRVIDAQTPARATALPAAPLVLAVVPATVRAVADIAAMFKSDVTASGTDYGEGTRALFATALAQACPRRIGGLGTGYFGEMDIVQHERLLGKVRNLAALRGASAQRIDTIGMLADAAKGETKRELAAIETAAAALLKTLDAFIDSLKAGDASDKSPLFNTARYLGYANRTAHAYVLDFHLRLEGMTLIHDRWFTGQRLRLSGVAFLWYRVHDPDGTLRLARALRKMTAPIDVDLRGRDVDGGFWNQPSPLGER